MIRWPQSELRFGHFIRRKNCPLKILEDALISRQCTLLPLRLQPADHLFQIAVGIRSIAISQNANGFTVARQMINVLEKAAKDIYHHLIFSSCRSARSCYVKKSPQTNFPVCVLYKENHPHGNQTSVEKNRHLRDFELKT